MRGRLIAAYVAVAALGLPGAAWAAGWSKPAILVKDRSDDLVLPYYLQSPNLRRTDLVVGLAFGRDTVYPMNRRGRLLRPWRIPNRRGHDAGYDLNDAGATAAAWLVDSPDQPPDDLRGPSYSWVRAAVRGPGGNFTRSRTITPAREVTGIGTAITPRGAATVFASVWNPEATVEPLRVAEARPRRRFGKSHVVVPSVLGWAIDSRHGRPILLYEERGHSGRQRALAAPWTRPATIGTLPGEGWFEGGDYGGNAFAGDGNGNELVIDESIAVAHRRAGGKFGPLRRIARPPRSDTCSMDIVMNRRLALAVWNCTLFDGDGRVQIAVLSPSGRLRWLSRVFPAWAGGETPDIALDRAGRWAVAWQVATRNDRYRTMVGRGTHPQGVRALPGPGTQSQTPDLAFFPGGIAHATWVDEQRRATNVMESRLRVR